MTICCLQEACFKCKYSDTLQDKGWGEMYHATTNQKEPRVSILTINRVESDGNFTAIKCSTHK